MVCGKITEMLLHNKIMKNYGCQKLMHRLTCEGA